MNRGARIRRIVLLLLSIILIGGGYLALMRSGFAPALSLQATPTQTATAVPRSFVVVAKVDIPEGSVITPALVETRPWPQDSIPEGTLIDPTRAFDQVALYDLAAGQPVVASALVPADEYVPPTPTPIILPGSLAGKLLEPGRVALAFPVDRYSGVAYALRPGDHVDVLMSLLLLDVDQDFQARLPNSGQILVLTRDEVTEEYHFVPLNTMFPVGETTADEVLDQLVYVVASEDQRPRLVTQLTIQNATVLGVGAWPIEEGVALAGVPTSTPTPQGAATPVGPAPTLSPPDMITLSVLPQDAVALEFMLSMGAQVTFVLRGLGDDTVYQTEPMTLDFIMERYGVPVPAKLPVVIDYPTPGPPTPTPSPIPPED